jgi:hypothetical protein
MITILSDLAPKVLGAEASGTVSSEDYESVLIPAVEAYLRDHDRVRVLLVLGPEFEGFGSGAILDDARLGMSHVKAWEKIAVVTDHEHWRGLIQAFAFMIPGEMRTFPLDQLADARTWVAA